MSKPTPKSSPSPKPQPAALAIFAKAPVPGQVKTRLCPPLTPDEAATLHGSFVIDMLERTKAAVAKLKLPLDRYLACAPASTLVFFQIMEERQSVKLIDQVGDDLGARMQQAFTTCSGRAISASSSSVRMFRRCRSIITSRPWPYWRHTM